GDEERASGKLTAVEHSKAFERRPIRDVAPSDQDRFADLLPGAWSRRPCAAQPVDCACDLLHHPAPRFVVRVAVVTIMAGLRLRSRRRKGRFPRYAARLKAARCPSAAMCAAPSSAA